MPNCYHDSYIERYSDGIMSQEPTCLSSENRSISPSLMSESALQGWVHSYVSLEGASVPENVRVVMVSQVVGVLSPVSH